MSAERIYLPSPLLQWYLQHGIKVTEVHEAIEFSKSRCFHPFVEIVTNARRDGDLDPNKAIIGDTCKLLGK